MSNSSSSSSSKRPYLIRAMHEWMADNGHTPHIVVDVSLDECSVPIEHIKDGKITLNIGDSAAHNLRMDNSAISFRARFSGVPFDVNVPVASILGIYARETGQGMIFSNDDEQPEPTDPEDDVDASRNSRSHLKIVK